MRRGYMMIALKKNIWVFFQLLEMPERWSLVTRGRLLAVSALIGPDVAVDLSDNPPKKSGVEVFSKSISAVIGLS